MDVAAVEKRLALLPKMSTQQLRDLWLELFKSPPHSQVRRELLIRVLAYRFQELEYGGLTPATQRKLLQLAQRFKRNPNVKLSSALSIKPGTRLIRDWRGRSHHVTVLEHGYEFSGKRYSSLSYIARLITGTRWSGPLFFGLKDNKQGRTAHDQRI